MTTDLDAAGRRFGTSKSSLRRDLLRVYEPLVAPIRDESFDLLEIGVGDGASLRMWLDHFPNARVVGLDVRRLALPDLPERCTLVHGAQDDFALLLDLIRRFRFRVVIDDGSRNGATQLAAFATLFPALEPGGFYACEGVWDPLPPRAVRVVPDPGDLPSKPTAAEEPVVAPDDRAPEPGLLDLAAALGRAVATGETSEPLPIDRARFAALRGRTAEVRFLPKLVIVSATGQPG